MPNLASQELRPEIAPIHADLRIGEVGCVALAPNLMLIETRPSLTPFQTEVIDLVSRGNTLAQVARQAGSTRESVKSARRHAMNEFDTNSIAVVVDRSISFGIISVETNTSDPARRNITGIDEKMINIYAKGFSNKRIAEATATPLQDVESYHDKLLEKIKAWSRPHAIRRAYEIGILKI